MFDDDYEYQEGVYADSGEFDPHGYDDSEDGYEDFDDFEAPDDDYEDYD
jgi:hypothetical protein